MANKDQQLQATKEIWDACNQVPNPLVSQEDVLKCGNCLRVLVKHAGLHFNAATPAQVNDKDWLLIPINPNIGSKDKQ